MKYLKMGLKFMDNQKNNYYHADKILKDIRFLVKHTKGITFDELVANEVLIDSIMFRFIQIHENIKKLTEDFKSSHSNIPWGDIAGFRNRIVHDYGKVDLRIIYDTVNNDLETLEQLFNNIV